MRERLKWLVLGLALATGVSLTAQVSPIKSWVTRELLTSTDLNSVIAALGERSLDRYSGTAMGTLNTRTLLPSANNTYNLGSTSFRYNQIWGNGSNLTGLTFAQLPTAWTTNPFNAGHFTGGGAMTWTVDSADVNINHYVLLGKTLLWSIAALNTDLGGTPNSELRITLPAGTSVLTGAAANGGCNVSEAGALGSGNAYWIASSGNTFVSILVSTATPNWTLTSADNTAVRCAFQIPLN